MSESYYRQRLMSEFQRLMNESKDASLISHPVLKGNIREQGLGRLIAQILPDGWDIGKGQIHDSFGNQSGEIDLIIYNKKIIPPLLFSEKEGIYPIESVLYVFEIKSKSTSKEISTTIEKFQKVRNLKSISKSYERLITIYFCFGTDLIDKSEYERYKELDEKWYWSPDIPIITVIGKGYWCYWSESKDKINFKSAWIEKIADQNFSELYSLIAGISNTIADENSSLKAIPGVGSYLFNEDSMLTFIDEKTYKFDNPV